MLDLFQVSIYAMEYAVQFNELFKMKHKWRSFRALI